MDIKISEEILAFFHRMRWFHTFKGWPRLGPGHILYLRDGARIAPYAGYYAGDHLPQMGAFSYIFSNLDREVVVGAYCSVSWNVDVVGINHPLNCFSTTAALYEEHPVFQAAFEDAALPPRYRPNPQKPMPVIGNDVWIGQDVLLGRGITIGDGAVVAARSLVVKDVQPYEIVGGVPARTLRFRFTEAERELLQWSRWWEYAMPDLMAGPVDDVARFVDGFVEGVTQRNIRKLAVFEESLSDLIRSNRLDAFIADKRPLIEPDSAFFLRGERRPEPSQDRKAGKSRWWPR